MLAIQAQETPLQPTAIQELDRLGKSTGYRDLLQKKLSKAVELITETSTQINDRGYEERALYNRKHSKQLANGEVEDIDAKQAYEDFRSRVESLTQKMDISIRQVIDDQVWLTDMPYAISHIKPKASNLSSSVGASQMTTQQTHASMDMDDMPEPNQDRPDVRPDPSRAPTALLDAAFSTAETKWHSKSLTDRYSEHNDYVGWYRMVYDAQHQGDNAPPMPHASMWFAAEEGRGATTTLNGSQPRRQQNSGNRTEADRTAVDAQSESESDVEIAAERIRVKCPITLLPYKDPMASTKCPHAFEKSAIREMFKHTSEHMPFTVEERLELSQISRVQDRNRRERQLKVPMVRCPECSVPLTEKDLRPDPVLLRKVNRVLQKERRAEEAQRQAEHDIMDAEDEDEDHDDEPLRGTQRRDVVHLGSSPATSMRRQSGRVVKTERMPSVLRTRLE